MNKRFFCDYKKKKKKKVIGILIRFCCFREVFDQRRITLYSGKQKSKTFLDFLTKTFLKFNYIH